MDPTKTNPKPKNKRRLTCHLQNKSDTCSIDAHAIPTTLQLAIVHAAKEANN